jgi:hypothetical protein
MAGTGISGRGLDRAEYSCSFYHFGGSDCDQPRIRDGMMASHHPFPCDAEQFTRRPDASLSTSTEEAPKRRDHPPVVYKTFTARVSLGLRRQRLQAA